MVFHKYLSNSTFTIFVDTQPTSTGQWHMHRIPREKKALREREVNESLDPSIMSNET